MTVAEMKLRELECKYTQCVPFANGKDESDGLGSPYFVEGPYKDQKVSDVLSFLKTVYFEG
jgi:hypothetical protein